MRVFIAEKPSLGRAIADGLGGGDRKDGYIDCNNGDKVTWCFGHLLELVNPEEYKREWKTWSKETLPIIPEHWRKEPRKDSGVGKQLNVISNLVENCSEVVNGGDPDREGQLIVDEVLEYIRYSGNVSRIWLAALDAKSVAKALASLEDNTKHANLKKAAEARGKADWLYGLNVTRALTIMGRDIGLQGVLSGGRVQTATLELVAARCREIGNFKPTDYFVLKALMEHENGSFSVQWKPEEGYLTDKKEAENIAASASQGNITRLSIEEKNRAAALPHSLSSLQAEANKRYGLSAKHTLDAAQKLYEAKLTTYPRSDCRYLPEEQFGEASEIVASLQQLFPLAAKADVTIKTKAWNTKKVTAHHGIIPTGENSASPLSGELQQVYELICLGFLRQFFQPLKYEAQTVEVDLAGKNWKASGSRVLDPGWSVLDSAPEAEEDSEEQLFPVMQEGDAAQCRHVETQSKRTKPPAYFTEGSLILAMADVHKFIDDPEAKKVLRENEGIGTEATRANTLETLKKRSYIVLKGKHIHVTGLGENTLSLSPQILKDPVTTAVWERQLADIATGKLYLDKFLIAQEKALPDMLAAILDANLDSFVVDVPKCPECAGPLRRWKSSKGKGHYWSCMNKEKHADGKPVFLPDEKGKPGTQRTAVTDSCPDCGKTIRRLESKKKKGAFFWACESGQCPLRKDNRGKVGEAFPKQ